MNKEVNTHQAILDTATALMQRCGYNAFSYADIAEQVGIRKASIHYHFPAKSDLARSAVAHYRDAARRTLSLLQIDHDPLQQLEQYITFYAEEFQGTPRMCLCALLAAEMPTLPTHVRDEVAGFYDDQERWLSDLLKVGIDRGQLRVHGSVEVAAQVLLAGLEGAMLAARAHNDPARFRTIAEALIRPYRVS